MNKVSMYTLSTCPWCRKTKNFFTEKGVAFDYVDYDLADPEEQARIVEEMKSLGGTTAFPFVKIGDEIVVGYDPEKYEQLIAKAA